MKVPMVAAGPNINFPSDGCPEYPAKSKYVVGIGSMNEENVADGNQNNFQCVDLFAPGVDVLAALNGTTTFGNITGTSPATPLVAGAIAIYLSMNKTVDRLWEDVESGSLKYMDSSSGNENGTDIIDWPVEYKKINKVLRIKQ